MNAEPGGTGERVFQLVALVLSAAGLLVGVSYTFHLNLVPVPIDTSYLYSILAIYGSLGFLFYRARQGPERRSIPWYDWLIFLVVFGCGMYLSWHGYEVVTQGWSMAPPPQAVVMSILLWLILMEGGRRAGGSWLVLLAAFFSVYPLLAPHLPGMLWGPPAFSFGGLAAYHFISNASVMGVPMQVIGQLVFGYIVFGAALEYTGAGKFFLEFALALMGTVRGGVAKVSIVATGLFGIFTGSTASNVIVTGTTIIPAMKKTGYPSEYAGALVACGALGGALSPPIMGAAAFLMAMVLGIPYSAVCAAATIPTVLYYWGLFVQADAFAARNGLRGLDRGQLVGLGKTLKTGWPYLVSLAVLMVSLFSFRQQAEAPFYASAFLLGYGMFRREGRFSIKTFGQFIVSTGKYLAELTLILGVVGFIIGSFYVTGLGGTMSYELTRMAGGNVWLLLVFCAVTSFILGTGLTASACYIFLAITIAPAMVRAGIDPIAAHMFILYWGLLSDLTPPTAVGCFVAAPIAEAPPMKIALKATRLGLILYIIPFFFVIDPSLVMQGPVWRILVSSLTAMLGVALIGGSLERYILGVGAVSRPVATAFLVAGLMFFYPLWYLDLIGLGIAVLTFAGVKLARARARA